MTATSDIKAGAAYVELYVNNSALVRGLKGAQKKLRGFSESVKYSHFSRPKKSSYTAGVKMFADVTLHSFCEYYEK